MKQDKDDKKEKILKKAKELILQKGYENLSVKDITEVLNISKGSFYTYFHSKSEMIYELIDEKIKLLDEKHKKIFSEAKSMEESLKLYLWSCFRNDIEIAEVQLVILNLFQNLSTIEEDLSEYLLKLEKKYIYFWEEELQKYQKNLSIDLDEIKEYSFYISKMIQWLFISIFFSAEDSRFLLGNIKQNIKKMDEDRGKKKIDFLIKNIMKMIQ